MNDNDHVDRSHYQSDIVQYIVQPCTHMYSMFHLYRCFTQRLYVLPTYNRPSTWQYVFRV